MPQPLTGSRPHVALTSQEGSIAQVVVVTPLKPSPPLSPKLIESSVRRSKLKLALSRQSAKETRSETSLASSKSDSVTRSHESLQRKSSTGIGFDKDGMVSTSSMSPHLENTTPARPNTSAGEHKEKTKPVRSKPSPTSSHEGSHNFVAIGHGMEKN